MHARLFSSFEFAADALSSFGICFALASIRSQLLHQRVPAQEVECAIDMPLIWLTIKLSPSIIPGIFTGLLNLTVHVISQDRDAASLHKLKNACVLGLYFACGDDADFSYQAAKFVCTSGAAWMSYKVVDAVTDHLGLPRL